MSKKANPTLVGGFVIGAIALFIVFLLAFSSGSMFQKRNYWLCYFEDSVSGLDSGAPVEFNGARIGTVTSLKIVCGTSVTDLRIPVILQIESERIELPKGITMHGDRNVTESVEELIKRGLKARLASQSAVTGKLKVEMGFWPDYEAKLTGHNDAEYPELPTMPSTFSRISQKLSELPLENIVRETHKSVEGLSLLVNNPDIPMAITNMNHLIANMNQVVAKMDAIVDESSPLQSEAIKTMIAFQRTAKAVEGSAGLLQSEQAGTAISNFNDMLKNLEEITGSLKEMVSSQYPLRYDTQRAMNEVITAAKSVSELADYIQRHPDSLIKGKK